MLKRNGGWGILNIRAFNTALLIKSLWRAITESDIWNDIIHVKYLRGDSLHKLYYGKYSMPKYISVIWLAFKKILPIFAKNIVWRFGNGLNISLGSDQIYGMGVESLHTMRIVHRLSHRGNFHLYKVIHYWAHGAPIVKTVESLGLTGGDAEDWKIYVQNIWAAGLCYKCEGDMITWDGVIKLGVVNVQETYAYIISLSVVEGTSKDFWPFSQIRIPPKVLLFGWLVWRNKILTWDSLMHRGFQDPGWCVLCNNEVESVEHLFFHVRWCLRSGKFSATTSSTHCEFQRITWRPPIDGTIPGENFKLCPFFLYGKYGWLGIG